MVSRRVAPVGSSYAEQRRYVVAVRLSDLTGPVSGMVTLDRSMDWSGDGQYDLNDPGDLQLMYQTVLNQASSVDDLRRWLEAATLRRVWPDLWLPPRLLALWRARTSISLPRGTAATSPPPQSALSSRPSPLTAPPPP